MILRILRKEKVGQIQIYEVFFSLMLTNSLQIINMEQMIDSNMQYLN